MPVITSTPTTDPKHTSFVAFNQHSFHDPYLPSSTNEEQPFQIPSDQLCPDLQNFRSSTSSTPRRSARPSSSPPNSIAEFPHLQEQRPLSPSWDYTLSEESYPFAVSLQPGQILPTSETLYSHHLSPSAAQSSENGYSDLSTYTTPQFDEDFLLESKYGLLPIDGGELDNTQDPVVDALLEPRQSNTLGIDQLGPTEWSSSTGATTASSHLISPAMTDVASPESGRGLQQSAIEQNQTQNGNHATHNNNTTGTSWAQTPNFVQQTPTLTDGSTNGSPEPQAPRSIPRAVSPVFVVETYTRGDSPARSATTVGRSGSKRSRDNQSSSHLAPLYNDRTSEEDDADTEKEGQNREIPIMNTAFLSQDTSPANDQRSGLDPEARGRLNDDYVPNFQDQAEAAAVAQKMHEVQDWLADSEAGSQIRNPESMLSRTRRIRTAQERRRAKSVGANTNGKAEGPRFDRDYDEIGIPGPGALLDVESGDDEEDCTDDEEAPESPPVAINVSESYFPPVLEESSEQQSHGAPPWRDLPRHEPPDDAPMLKMQPDSSNAAMMRFTQRVKDMETMSRVATWGTRRLSETDVDSIIGADGMFCKLSVGKDQEQDRHKRGNIFEQAAAKVRPKRGNSIFRRKGDDANHPVRTQTGTTLTKTESAGGLKNPRQTISSLPQRMSSTSKRPRSPTINTGSAMAVMANQIASIGGSGSFTAHASSSPTSAWASAKNVLKGKRSRGELKDPASSGASEPGLAELWNKSGGPPIPTLASPPIENSRSSPIENALDGKQNGKEPEENDDDDDEDNENMATKGKGIAMDLSVRTELITPTFDGFKVHVRQLNPRLPLYMVDRVGQEQLRRYKKLTEFKVNHLKALRDGRCGSGKHCAVLGGEPTYLAPKKEPDTMDTAISHNGASGSDEDADALADGVISATQFPPGVPLPPVKRLPAEFECFLCFKVKKFYKPSDWSKHVHEDLQPFTCTFPECPEPKSFMRKADWVRHENERHRHLEWWTCNIQDCSHTCYRKNNFVQHLVREHKYVEPKTKIMKAAKTAVRGPVKQKSGANNQQIEVMGNWNYESSAANSEGQDNVQDLWRMVENRMHKTTKQPMDEPCRFCNNICTTWKKLTVHLAKHMEQISIPILDLVKQQNLSPETIISPLEQRARAVTSASPLLQNHLFQATSNRGSLKNVPTKGPPLIGMPRRDWDYYSNRNQKLDGWPADSSSTYAPQHHPQTQAMQYPNETSSASAIPEYAGYEQSQFLPLNEHTAFHPGESVPDQYVSLNMGIDSQAQQAQTAPSFTDDGGLCQDTFYEQQRQQETYPQSRDDASMYAPYQQNASASFAPQAPAGAPMQGAYNDMVAYSQAPDYASVFGHVQAQGYPFRQ